MCGQLLFVLLFLRIIVIYSGCLADYCYFCSANHHKYVIMNRLHVTRIASLPSTAAEVLALLDSLNVAFQPIASVNWPAEYPYCPEAAFRMAWCSDGLVLHYRVTEQSVRARYGEDNGNVWTDSCVECFLRNADEDTYYNIECNCIGTLLVGVGTGRHDRRRMSADVLAGVKRWASLGDVAFDERIGVTSWEVALVIPVSLFDEHPIALEARAALCANFYKCGDELAVPHFLSWNPIEVATPDFHRPEFFGTLLLD